MYMSIFIYIKSDKDNDVYWLMYFRLFLAAFYSQVNNSH